MLDLKPPAEESWYLIEGAVALVAVVTYDGWCEAIRKPHVHPVDLTEGLAWCGEDDVPLVRYFQHHQVDTNDQVQ